jgi:hypothetical protein
VTHAAAPVDPQAMADLLERVAAGDLLACLDAAERVVADLRVPVTDPAHLVVLLGVEAALAGACAVLVQAATEPA